MNAQRADNGFREFVLGFSDPLARLAFLLTAGTSTGGPASSVNADTATAQLATINALAQIRRQWHDVGTSGSPETVAIEALVGALPRAHRNAPAAAVAESPIEGAPAASDDDVEVLRAGLWHAWTRLAPRQRVPMVFADASVASSRLAGLDVPESLGRARTREALAADAVGDLKQSLATDSSTRSAAAALDDRQLISLLLDVLREHASTTATPIDPYPLVVARARHSRLRASIAVGAVVLVLVAATAVAVRVSKPATSSAARSAASASATRRPQALQPTQPAGPAGLHAAAAGLTDPVIDWPARGTAAFDTDLLAKLEDSFGSAHPDATGIVQVLLATDTSAFRVAYVTARSPSGIIQSWFYGTPGSTDLVEGAWSYGGTLVADATVLASVVVDPEGRAELVVMAPPATSDIQLADFEFGDTSGHGFQPLPHEDGIETEPIDVEAAPALILRVTVGANILLSQSLPVVTLGSSAAGPTTSAQPSQPLAPVPVVRGTPDPRVLELVERAAAAWHNSDAPGTPIRLTVLWAGTDEVGTRLVVARLKMRTFDVLLFDWGNAPPDEGGQYLIDSSLPDAPIAFAYQGLDGTRIGVLAPPVVAGSSTAVVTSALVMPGQPAWGVEFDSTGFASEAMPGINSLTDISANVDLLDAAGHVVDVVPVPPPA